MNWFSIIKQQDARWLNIPPERRLQRIRMSFPGNYFYVVKDRVWRESVRGGMPEEGQHPIPLIEHYLERYLTDGDFALRLQNFLPDLMDRQDGHDEVIINRIGGEEGQKQFARRFLELPEEQPQRSDWYDKSILEMLEDGTINQKEYDRKWELGKYPLLTSGLGNVTRRSNFDTEALRRFLGEEE